MKSWNAGVNSRARTRLGLLSFLTLMIVLFSTGVSVAADQYRLYQRDARSNRYVEVKHASDAEKKEAVGLVFTEPTPKNFESFVTKFQSEPFKFVEGIRTAMLELKSDEAKLKAFKTDTVKALEAVSNDKFGTTRRKLALLDVVNKLFGMELSDAEKEDFLQKLLEDPYLREELGLKTQEELDADRPKEEPKKEQPKEQPKEEPTKTPPTTDTGKTPPSTETKTGDTGKTPSAIDEQLKALADEFRAFKEGGAKTPSVTPPPPAAPPALPGARVGEQDDALLRRTAQEICDKFNALQRGVSDQLLASINPLKDALNETFNQLAGLSRRGNENQGNQNKNRLEDILPGLIADTLKNDRGNNQVTPPQPIAQQPNRAARNDRNNNNDQLPLPPPKQEEPEQKSVPFAMPNPTKSQIGSAIELDGLPSPTVGKRALYDAEDQIAANTRVAQEAVPKSMQNTIAQVIGLVQANPNPATVSIAANSVSQMLGAQKAKVSDAKNRTQAQLQQITQTINNLEERMSQLQREGARGRVPEAILDEQERLKKEVEQKEKAYQSQKQMIQQSGDPEALQKIAALDQDLAAAQSELARVSKVIDRSVKRGDGQIEAVKARIEKLSSAKTELSGQLETLNQKEQEIENQATQFQATLQQVMTPAQQPAGAPNAQRIMGFGGGNGAPRTVPSRIQPRGAASQPQSGAAGGGVMRGSLSSKGAQ